MPNQSLFAEYKNALENLSDTKRYKNSKSFKALSKQEQEEEMQRRLFDYILEIEREKLKFFALTYKQKTLIIKAPDKIDEQKKFLGYVISDAKNKKSGLTEGDGLLSDKENRNAQDKIAYAIKQSFKGKFHNHESFGQYVAYVKTCNLLNFSNVEFNKTISLNTGQDSTSTNLFADSKYEIVKIKQICEIGRGRIINHEYINKNKGEYPIYSSQTKNEGIMGYIDTFDFDGEYVTWTTDGIYAGTCFYRKGKFNCTNVCGVLKIKNINEIIYYYLSLALNLVTSNYVVKSANPKLMNNVMAEIQIPLPPLEIQEKIVEVIEKIENKKKSLLDSKQGIEGKIQNILEKYLF